MSDFHAGQREYYNGIAEEYDRHFAQPHAMAYRARVYDGILRDLPLAGLKVLDAACGGGENALYFAAKGAVVSGLDISDAQCRLFAERFPAAEVTRAPLIASGLASDSFDMVVTEALHHMHPEVNGVVEEIRRILRPGGYFLFWEPAAGSLFDLARKAWYRLDPKFFLDNEASIDGERLMRRHAAGFERVALRYGGSVAHLLVLNSMALRIPAGAVRHYARAALALDALLDPLVGRRFALWTLGLMRKR